MDTDKYRPKAYLRESVFICGFLILFFMVLSFGAYASENPQFFSSIPDMPLMSGLKELPDQTVAFDKPEGRIIESVALIETQKPDEVARFYNETLPQLGWMPSGDLSFRREEESLKVSIEGFEGRNFLHVIIAPLDAPASAN